MNIDLGIWVTLVSRNVFFSSASLVDSTDRETEDLAIVSNLSRVTSIIGYVYIIVCVLQSLVPQITGPFRAAGVELVIGDGRMDHADLLLLET